MADLFDKWKQGLERTRKVAFGRLSTIFGATEITVDTWDELEATLVQADIGIETTQQLLKKLILRVDQEGVIKTSELLDLLKVGTQEFIAGSQPNRLFKFSSRRNSVGRS